MATGTIHEHLVPNPAWGISGPISNRNADAGNIFGVNPRLPAPPGHYRRGDAGHDGGAPSVTAAPGQ
jgi:hypothetical protein